MDSIERQLAEQDLQIEPSTLDLLRQLEVHGSLSLGWPRRPCVPKSLVWLPKDLDFGRATAIVSSRLGRQVDRLDPIFRVFRAAISQLDPQRQCLLSAEGTTMSSYVLRASELFGVPLLKVETPRPNLSLDQWAKSCLEQLDSTNENELLKQCFVSNPLCEQSSELPLQDQVEVFASDQLLVLRARKHGNLHTLLKSRLACEDSTRVFVAIGDDRLVPQDLRTELMDQGAVGWFPRGSDTNEFQAQEGTSESTTPILYGLENQDRYLIHCTRRAKGAWPDQAEHEFLDELILGAPSRDRSCFAALSRIVQMQRLLATHESIRDSTPVVSFTGAQLDELSEMRTFRSHRGRWDFEPYGIAIDRHALIHAGAREVIYGDDPTWDAMAAEERPLFQRVGQAPGAIDWSVEKEWRVIGDVDLLQIEPDKAVVFVPSQDEAEQLARISRWPIVVVRSANRT